MILPWMFGKCSLEFWFYMLLIVIVGNLPNAQVAVAAVSIW